MSTESEDPILDAMIEAEVERALATPKARKLPPEMQEETRILLRIGLRNHPQARLLLEQLRPSRGGIQHSTKVATADHNPATTDAKGTKVGGGR
jgi:hypothetical protein